MVLRTSKMWLYTYCCTFSVNAIRREHCVMYASLCVLYLLLHKVRNVFIDVVYVQLWCVWSNQREFLSCAEQMRSESCVCVPSPRECHIMGSRAWQKTPLRFVSYQSEIDLAVVRRILLPRIPRPLLEQMLKCSDQSLFLGLFVKLLWNNM